MTKLKFDPAARGIEGRFASQAGLVAACETRDIADPAYAGWATAHDVNGATGSILTTAYNPDLLSRRYEALRAQLMDRPAHKGGMNFTVAPNLLAAFTDAASAQPRGTFKALILSTTRETLYFDLKKLFPPLDLKIVHAIPKNEALMNYLVHTQAPEIADRLIYQSEWQKQPFNLVQINTAITYEDEQGVKDLIKNIADTGASHVVFNNILVNEDENGAAYWRGQRYSGGIIPLRIPARGEIQSLMEAEGYMMQSETAAGATFDVNKQSSFKVENPKLDNYFFTLG